MTDSLTVRDNRTGHEYDVPITDGTIKASDIGQIKTAEDTATIDQSDRDFNDLVFEILVPPSDFAPEFATAECPHD